jgi:hypothetical protein
VEVCFAPSAAGASPSQWTGATRAGGNTPARRCPITHSTDSQYMLKAERVQRDCRVQAARKGRLADCRLADCRSGTNSSGRMWKGERNAREGVLEVDAGVYTHRHSGRWGMTTPIHM